MSDLFSQFSKWKEDFDKYFTPDHQTNTFIDTPAVNGRIRIPRRHYICAMVCNEIYKEPNLRQKDINGYLLDTRYNDTRTVVYKKSLLYDDSFIIGIRGTSSDLTDLASDALITLGKENLSLRKYLQIKYVKEIVDKLYDEGYSLNESFITGHSLGALITAYALMEISNVKGIGFNTGTSPLHIPSVARFRQPFKKLLDGVADSFRFVNYHVKGDFLSVSSTYLFKDTVILSPSPAPSAIQAHRISYILQETQPNPPFD